jgi:hypothetical protein
MGSWTYEIFIDSKQPAEEFAESVGDILGIQFLPVTGEREVFNPEFYLYWFYEESSHMLLSIGTHNFITDAELDFPTYHYDLEVGTHGISHDSEKIRLAEIYSRQAFAKLKAARRYRMMLVYDVQILIEKYDPAVDSQLSSDSQG